MQQQLNFWSVKIKTWNRHVSVALEKFAITQLPLPPVLDKGRFRSIYSD